MEAHATIENHNKIPEPPPDQFNAHPTNGQHQPATQNNYENLGAGTNANKNEPSAAAATTTSTTTTASTTTAAADGDNKNINNNGNDKLTTSNAQPSDIITTSTESNG